VSKPQGDRGAAVVEFAMVSLLLITLMIAVLEGSRLFLMQATLASAARDAAREMAISGDQVEAEAAAASVFFFGSPSWDAGASTVCPSPPSAGDNATVSLTYSTGMITNIWSNTFDLRGTGTMRCGG
jgi:Flp pilus assembly protein TadG